ncbi:sporulation domain-containing protein [Janibacter sp. Soil728]|uniref:phosphodiester glycosidase family protein n=1 Tax=Janibacter sp. Soil728 TaxID=1736393 RepID=UPI0006FFF020|nr:phosphodiester glycosidase family protein [Janibacter sp. Soil728]KRE39160.1 sporulation domain-containing protein [Janibacter sp. Soil728]
MTSRRRVSAISAGAVGILMAGSTAIPTLSASASTQGPADTSVTRGSEPLPLGPSDLPEERTSRTLQPGVTFTHIDRGAPSPDVPWVVELNIPPTSSSKDPDGPARSVQDKASADALVSHLRAAGFSSRAEPVRQPAVADVDAGVIGHRVRLSTTHQSRTEADATAAKLKAHGFSGRTWYAGWDGGSRASGHWSVNVVTIDPNSFEGRLTGTYGPDLEQREKTTELARSTGASAAVNGGFFTMSPKAGAEGDPSGVGVYDGVFASEPVGDRPALVLQQDARRTAVTRPTWEGTIRLGSRTVDLDGKNRVPGLIRNCGGDASDSPTFLPMHDTTCTDSSELVAFDSSFGARTPSGPGTEAVLDRSGRVTRVLHSRGAQLRDGETSVQGIGSKTTVLETLEVGDRVGVKERVDIGAPLTPRTTVVNGGPELVRSGSEHITQKRDGMNQVDNPSFDYGWVLQRNPRTFAGTDAKGRTVLVTVDGRQPDQLGVSIPEAAAVAKSLGMREAINLDGGGSTAMSVKDQLVSSPSDAGGERPVGDAIVVR